MSTSTGDHLQVMHLLFADDTLVMCDADIDQMLFLHLILSWFEIVSGLKINLDTSELVFFLIGNQKFIINEKEKKKVQVVHDDEQQEKKNKQHSKTRHQETKLREDINSEREEQSVKPQQ